MIQLEALGGITRGLLGLLALLIALGVGGSVVQTLAEAREARAYPAPGRLVDVGGHTMHIRCIGLNQRGNPTVILEQGSAGTSLAWFLVQPELAVSTRVCAYDRAGLGWSEAGPEPRSGQQIAQELHALLQTARVPGPFVLAGWSYGGLIVRAYAALYPAEVVGLALLDASHTDQWTDTEKGRAEFTQNAQIYSVARLLVRLGVFRLIPTPLTEVPSGLSSGQSREWMAVYRATKLWDTTEAESRALPQTTAQVRNSRGLGDVPLMVVSAGIHMQADPIWAAHQADLMTLSSDSRQRVVNGATHVSLWSNPADARATTAAIIEVVEEVGRGDHWRGKSP